MKAAGHLVSAVSKLTACVQDGKYNLHCGTACFFLNIYGNSPPIVHHCDGIIRIDRDLYGIAISGQGFIYRIVHDLIYQMMESTGRCAADIHAGPLSHGLKPFQYLNLICSVLFSHIL